MNTYKIPECNMESLNKKLATIEKKCNKYDCSFSFNVVEEIMEDIGNDKDGHLFYKFYIVNVEGLAKVNDWEFLATLEHTQNGNIIRQYNTSVYIPESYRTVKPHCEHCKTDRYRKDTYLIYNSITKEIKQVGKSCLKDFTNGLSAEMVTAYLQYFVSCERYENSDFSSTGTKYFEVKNYLLNVVEVVKKVGFISKSKSQEEGRQSTANLTWKCMHPINKYDREEIEKINFVLDNPENKAEVENMLTWIKSADSTNDYIYNLQVACGLEYSEFRNMGIIASLPSAYYKAMNDIKEREQKESNASKSEFFGNVKDKIELENANIQCIANYETIYGITHVYKITKDSFIFIWKTANSFEDSNNVKIKGTIKAHNIFREEKQTELTRCKIL